MTNRKNNNLMLSTTKPSLPAPMLQRCMVALIMMSAQFCYASTCINTSGSEAIAVCEREIKQAPGNVNIRLHYADELIKLRRHKKAAAILKEALSIQPNNEAIRQKYKLTDSLAREKTLLGKGLKQQSRPATENRLNKILCETLKGQRAVKACDKVLKTSPNDASVWLHRGDQLMALNQVNAAIGSYRKAAKLAGNNTEVQNKLQAALKKLPRQNATTTFAQKKTLRQRKKQSNAETRSNSKTTKTENHPQVFSNAGWSNGTTF